MRRHRSGSGRRRLTGLRSCSLEARSVLQRLQQLSDHRGCCPQICHPYWYRGRAWSVASESPLTDAPPCWQPFHHIWASSVWLKCFCSFDKRIKIRHIDSILMISIYSTVGRLGEGGVSQQRLEYISIPMISSAATPRNCKRLHCRRVGDQIFALASSGMHPSTAKNSLLSLHAQKTVIDTWQDQDSKSHRTQQQRWRLSSCQDQQPRTTRSGRALVKVRDCVMVI